VILLYSKDSKDKDLLEKYFATIQIETNISKIEIADVENMAIGEKA